MKSSNFEINKLKSRKENGTEVKLVLWIFHQMWWFRGNFKNKTNVPHKTILTDIQVSRLSKAFRKNYPANIKLSKPQLSLDWTAMIICRKN